MGWWPRLGIAVRKAENRQHRVAGWRRTRLAPRLAEQTLDVGVAMGPLQATQGQDSLAIIQPSVGESERSCRANHGQGRLRHLILGTRLCRPLALSG